MENEKENCFLARFIVNNVYLDRSGWIRFFPRFVNRKSKLQKSQFLREIFLFSWFGATKAKDLLSFPTVYHSFIYLFFFENIRIWVSPIYTTSLKVFFVVENCSFKYWPLNAKIKKNARKNDYYDYFRQNLFFFICRLKIVQLNSWKVVE